MSIGLEIYFIAVGVAYPLTVLFQPHVLAWRSARKKDKESRKIEKVRRREEMAEAKSKERRFREIEAVRHAMEDLTRKLDRLERRESGPSEDDGDEHRLVG